MPPTPPRPTVSTALMFLWGRADSVPRSFFVPTKERTEQIQWNFEGLTLAVQKRTFSEADPSRVSYEIYLGPLLIPLGERFLLATVLRPKADTEANRTAFKLYLEELAHNPASVMSQHNA